jgi:5-methyltetrahydrofolate--homocysteine methyltransferase
MEESIFRSLLKKRVIIFDGAMGTNIQTYNLSKEDFQDKEGLNDYLVLTRPDVIREIHGGFLKVGVDVLETNTFGSNRLKLGEYGIANQVKLINQTAVQLAREVANQYSTPDRPRMVVGSMGPTGMLPSSEDPDLGNISVDELEDIYFEQACALVEAQVDALLIETSQDLLEMRAATFGCHRARQMLKMDIPIIAQTTLDTTGRMLLGSDIGVVLSTFLRLPIDVLGMNCSTGPHEMKDAVRFLSQYSPFPISTIPNAGLPENRGGQACYPLKPEELASALEEFVKVYGVSIIGGCCGTTHEHLKQVVDRVGSQVPKSRKPLQMSDVSSMIKRVSLDQNPQPLLIGERINAQGSKKMKKLLLEENYGGIVAIARDQSEGGAHVLDVCVALTERADEKATMKQLVKKLTLGVEAPLMIDSTEADVIEIALKNYPGRALVNSINLEGDGSRLKRICPLIKKYGSVVVALTIDDLYFNPSVPSEKGMAKTRHRKLQVAQRIYEACTNEYDIPPEDIVFDPLTFTLATGEEEFRNSAVETLEGIRMIKQTLPQVRTVLGLSNVSFGLSKPAREVLNSVFLYHAVQAGLDMAILNPVDIRPYSNLSSQEKNLAEDLLFNRELQALANFIQYFSGFVEKNKTELENPLEHLTSAQKIHWKIVNRKSDQIEEDLAAVLKDQDPVAVLNTILLPAMKEVGDKFGSGELILPFVLQSAEVMKKAVAYVEQFLDKNNSITKGTIVLATVYGDVHDIGKNLVRTILSNNGFTVYDLGKQVPIATIIEKAKAVQADAIGLSALLVSTSKQMPICVEELDKMGLSYPVLVGGAAINRRYGYRISFIQGEKFYEPGVFYAKDAFEGLDILNALMDLGSREQFRTKVKEQALQSKHDGFMEKVNALEEVSAIEFPPTVLPAENIPKAPFYGSSVLRQIPLREVWPFLDLTQLYKLNWGVKGKDADQYKQLIHNQFEPLRIKLQEEAITRGYFEPQVVYGFWPANAQGNELIIYEENLSNEKLRFKFHRQKNNPRHLCLSDYFLPVLSNHKDVIAFHVVTIGNKATQLIEALNEAGKYTEAYYWHGLSVQTAEALAEWTHRKIRKDLGVPIGQGLRYSPGYPACPEQSDQLKIFQLLDPDQMIGVRLTEAFMMIPEQSTSALIVHHPSAEYFSVQ